jgi:DNA-directed RNA polymerase subunit RPC12/RpoP
MDNKIFYTCRSCGKRRKLEKVGPMGYQCPECKGGAMLPSSTRDKGENTKRVVAGQGKPNRRKIAGKGGRRKTSIKKAPPK